MNIRFPALIVVAVAALGTASWSAALPTGSFTRPDDMQLQHGRFGHAAVSLGDHIYVMGGAAAGLGLNGTIERIDPATRDVTVLPYTLRPRIYITAVSHADRIIVLGGGWVDGTMDEFVEAFDPATGEVRILTKLPRPRLRPRAVVYDGKLFVMGGSRDRTAYTEVDIYDFEADEWTRGADKPTATECGLALVEDRIYAVGGYDWTAGTTVFEVYHIAEDRWETLAPLPVRTSAHSVVAANGRIYSFGDYHQLNRSMAYDPGIGEWNMMRVVYQDGRHNDAVVHDGDVWVIGGNTRGSGSFLALLHRFPLAHLETAKRVAITAADDRTPARPTAQVVAARTPSRSPAVSDEVRALCEQLAAALDRIETLSLRWERRSVHSLMGELGSARDLLEWVYEAPDRFYVSGTSRNIEGTAKAGSGSFRTPSRSLFFEGEIGTLVSHLQLPPDLHALIAQSARAHLLSVATNQRWQRLPDSEQDGGIYAVVRAEQRVPFFPTRHDPVLLYFNLATGLLSHMELEKQDAANEAAEDSVVAELLGETTTLIRATDVIVNEPLDDALWREVRMADGDDKVEAAPEVIGIRSTPSVCGARSTGTDALFGKPAPDFELKLLDGETFRLADHKGKVVIMDFWATWCGPCVRAMPHMRELAENLAEEDVVILGVSRDRRGSDRQVQQMLEQHKITYPNGIDVDNIAQQFGVSGIPNVILIDRDGIVRSRKVGFNASLARTLEAEAREWLAKAPTEPVTTASATSVPDDD